MAHEDSLNLIVNLEQKTVTDRKVTFDQIVRLAYPDKADDPNTTFTVTYRKSDEAKHDGSMVEGDKVEIKKDGTTSFTVVYATKS
jgi:hypothetical protein